MQTLTGLTWQRTCDYLELQDSTVNILLAMYVICTATVKYNVTFGVKVKVKASHT